MINSQINKTFLKSTDSKTKTLILGNIAAHYGISNDDAMQELINDDAEHLLDYMTGSERTACSLIMKRQGF